MTVTAGEIANRAFQVRWRGYDRAETRAFLEEVAEEVARLTGEIERLAEDGEALRRRVGEHAARETAIHETLLTVRGVAEEIRGEARREADLIVREANIAADDLLRKAREQVVRIEEEISRLRLERDAFEDRVRLLAEEHLRLIEARHQEGEVRDRLRFLGRRTAPASGTGPEPAGPAGETPGPSDRS